MFVLSTRRIVAIIRLQLIVDTFGGRIKFYGKYTCRLQCLPDGLWDGYVWPWVVKLDTHKFSPSPIRQAFNST